jgi:gluconate 2-dehydrogenase gamma chain
MPMPESRKGLFLSRRQFVAAGAAGGAALAIGCSVARRGNREYLSEDEARTLGAICDQIVPGDGFPSATQAGVLDYIDRQLVRHYRRHQDAYRQGLKDADARSRSRFGRALAEASAEQQLEIVSELEGKNHEFFELVRNHTMEGYYGTPRHGGNRDAVSWRMLGLNEPPLLGRAQYDLRKGPQS